MLNTVKKIQVWDATVDNTTSIPPTLYGLVQEELWMQEKNEIGFNFYNFFNESTEPMLVKLNRYINV